MQTHDKTRPSADNGAEGGGLSAEGSLAHGLMSSVGGFPTRRGGAGSTGAERRVGWRGDDEHGFRRLCEVIVEEESHPVPGRPNLARGEELYCGNDASIIWVNTYNGSVEFMCAEHIADPHDEALEPVEASQVSRWETIVYTATPELTGRTPVAMKDCPDDAFRRAEAVAERLAGYAALPKTWEIEPGFMGSREDEAAACEAGEHTTFPHIPESLQPCFGGGQEHVRCRRRDRP